MSNFFFNKETASIVAAKANEIIENQETSMLEKAIAISALAENIYDTAHTMVGGIGINLFMAYVLSEVGSNETRAEFLNFTPTSAETLQAFREVNNSADVFYTNLHQYLNKIMDENIQSTEEAHEAIGALMPAIFESGLFKSAMDFASTAVNDAAAAVMQSNPM